MRNFTTAQRNRYQRNIDQAWQREDDNRSMGRAVRQTPAQRAASDRAFALLAKTWHPRENSDGWYNALDGRVVLVDPRIADPEAVIRDRAEMEADNDAARKGTK